MRLGQKLALNMTPLCLRLALGAAFIWAGSAKLFYDQPFEGESAALLANLGLIPGPGSPDAATPEKAATPAAPSDRLNPQEPAKPESSPEAPDTSPAMPPAAASIRRVTWSQPLGSYTGADFPEPRPAKRMYILAVMLHAAAQPDSNGASAWPAPCATPQALRLLPWVVSVTELLGGALVLLGFGARLWGFALACVMGVALWLTSIHPAIASGSAFLKFLPPPMLDDPSQWATAWQSMMFQFMLLMAALAVMFGGAGCFSLDRAMFKRSTPPASAPKPPPAT